jgi:hypothetical protein
MNVRRQFLSGTALPSTAKGRAATKADIDEIVNVLFAQRGLERTDLPKAERERRFLDLLDELDELASKGIGDPS